MALAFSDHAPDFTGVELKSATEIVPADTTSLLFAYPASPEFSAAVVAKPLPLMMVLTCEEV